MSAHMFAGKIMTVTGAIEPGELGVTLPHEHIMSTFGADAARYPHYKLERFTEIVMPYLAYMKTLGLQAVVDGTAAYFGRHPELLRKIALESGLKILTNTGYYAAANDRYVPAHAYVESAEQIAARWVHEFRDGIDETGIRPGFIKTAIDAGALSEIDQKLVRAAAITHRETGLVIQTHTGDNRGAVEKMLAILREEGVKPSAWIWVHAHNVRQVADVLWAAQQGVWISLDGIQAETAAHILELLAALKQSGHLGQVLLSHDGNTEGNGNFRPYHWLFTDFIPQLNAAGYPQVEIQQMICENPRRAYTIAG